MSNEPRTLAPAPRKSRCSICGLWHEELHAQITTVWVNGVEYLVPEERPKFIHVGKEK